MRLCSPLDWECSHLCLALLLLKITNKTRMKYSDPTSMSPVPLRTPSPDTVSSSAITTTRQVTFTPQKKQQLSLAQELDTLRKQNEKLRQKTNHQPEEYRRELERKDKVIVELRDRLQRLQKARTLEEHKNKEIPNVDDLLKKIAMLQGQNQELWNRLNSLEGHSLAYQGELEGIRVYLTKRLNQTAEIFNNKLSGRLDVLQRRLGNIENHLDRASTHPRHSSLAYTPSPAKSYTQTFEASPFKASIEELQAQLQTSRNYQKQLQTQFRHSLSQRQQLQNDNLAIRSKLKQYEQLLIKMRLQNTSSTQTNKVKPNFGQLIQENEALNDTISSLRRSYNQMIGENGKLKEDLKYSMSVAEQSRNILRKVEEQKGRLMESKGVLEEQVFNLKRELKEAFAKQRLNMPPAMPGSGSEMPSRIADYQSSIQSLQQRISHLQSQNEFLHKNRLSETQGHHPQLTSQSNLQYQLDGLRIQLQKLTLQHQRVLRYSQQIQIELQELKQGRKNSVNDSYLSQLSSQYNSLLKEYNLMKSRNSDIEIVIVGLRDENLRIKEMLVNKQKEIQRMRQKQIQMQRDSSKYEHYQNVLREMSEAIRGLNPEEFLHEILGDIKGTKSLLSLFSADSLRSSLVQTSSQYKILSQQLVSQIQLTSQLKLQYSGLQSQLQVKDNQISILNDRIQHLNDCIRMYVSPQDNHEMAVEGEKEDWSVIHRGEEEQDLKKMETANGECRKRVQRVREITERIEQEIKRAIRE